MPKNQLFKIIPDLKIIHSILDSFGLDNLEDTRLFTKNHMNDMNTVEKIKNYSELSPKTLSDRLAVRYIVTGTLWKIDDVFQLSVELYDTKDKKIVWSDRWQKRWDNLPSIMGSLSDGLLKALDTKPIV